MSSNLGLATGELQHMEIQTTQVGGESLWKEAFKRLLRDKVVCEKLRGAKSAEALYAILTADASGAASAA